MPFDRFSPGPENSVVIVMFSDILPENFPI